MKFGPHMVQAHKVIYLLHMAIDCALSMDLVIINYQR